MTFPIPECYGYQLYTESCEIQTFSNLWLTFILPVLLIILYFLIKFYFLWKERKPRRIQND